MLTKALEERKKRENQKAERATFVSHALNLLYELKLIIFFNSNSSILDFDLNLGYYLHLA